MTKLREQMIQDMSLRGFSPNTQRAYLRAVTRLARHYDRSPDFIGGSFLAIPLQGEIERDLTDEQVEACGDDLREIADELGLIRDQ